MLEDFEIALMGGHGTGLRVVSNPPCWVVWDSHCSRLARFVIVESNLCLLDQSGSFESVIQNLELLDRQISVDFDHDTLYPNSGCRETGHLENYLLAASSLREQS
jgi:hypothetical protein